MYKIVNKRQLNDSVTLMDIYAPLIAKKALPGQFIIFRTDENGERIPLTIADYDAQKGTVTIIFQLVGKSTIALGQKKVGDSILDFVGPLGTPSHLDGAKNVAVIGGGVGCAIAYPQAKHLFNNGTKVDIIAGFRNKDIVILEDEMEKACTNLYLTTDDGSYKKQGFVTNALEELIKNGENYDMVIAIGPIPMMRAVSNLTKKYNIKTIVSLNPIMIDGTGMCGGCRVTVDGKIKFACIDGPDFDAHLVDFDELMKRNTIYRKDETEQKEHYCNLTKEMRK